MKKISLIIPVYNGSKYIDECIDSILNNSNLNDNVEIIIVNDGSTDDSALILKKYNEKYDFIKVFNNSNHGVSYSRNYGIKKATGEYLMFVDIDDKLSKDWLELNIDVLKEKKDIVYFSNIKIDKKQDLIDYIAGFNNENICISQPFSKVFKRDFILKNNLFFKENLINGEDMIFNIEALLKTDDYIVIDKHFYFYRQVIGSATKSFNEKILENENNFQKYLLEINKDRVLDSIAKFSKTNGLFVIIDRICYLKSFNRAKKYLLMIDSNSGMDDADKYIKSIYKKTILKLFFNKQYFIIYLLCKFKNVCINFKLKKEKDNFKLM